MAVIGSLDLPHISFRNMTSYPAKTYTRAMSADLAMLSVRVGQEHAVNCLVYFYISGHSASPPGIMDFRPLLNPPNELLHASETDPIVPMDVSGNSAHMFSPMGSCGFLANIIFTRRMSVCYMMPLVVNMFGRSRSH